MRHFGDIATGKHAHSKMGHSVQAFLGLQRIKGFHLHPLIKKEYDMTNGN
jgi:hypothetical protein